MELVSIDLQRISLGALIIALTLLVDDVMSTIDAMTMRLAQGDEKEQAATFAYKTLAFPMLTGSLVTMAGFVPIGFAKSLDLMPLQIAHLTQRRQADDPGMPNARSKRARAAPDGKPFFRRPPMDAAVARIFARSADT
jgi:hypothetical protein